MREISHWDAFRIFLLHIAAGPPIGGLAALALVVALDAGAMRAANVATMLPPVLLASYFVGIVPAGVTGAWAASTLRSKRRYLAIEAAIIGGLSGSAYLLALSRIARGSSMQSGQLILLALVCVAGVVAALICRQIIAWAGYSARAPDVAS